MSRHRSQQDILTALGQRIAELRTAAGLTQDSLSFLSGVDVQPIQRAETGRSALSLERLERVAGAVGVGLSALFDSSEVPAPEWSAEEAQVVAALRAIPEERRDLALPLLNVLVRGTARPTYQLPHEPKQD